MPYEYVGKTVDIEIQDKLLKVFYRQEQIAIHSRITDRGKFSTVASHYPKFKVFAQDVYQNIYRDKMADLGPYSEKLFSQVIEKQPGNWTRTVKGILSLTNFYSADTVEASCKRALAFGLTEYQAVKRICKTVPTCFP